MDKTDRDIVRLLREDGRISHEQIAQTVHLSRPAVHERIRRMEREGAIQGYAVRANGEAIGLPLTAFIWVRTAGACLPIGQAILGLSSANAVAEECYRLTGEWCLLVKAQTASPLALETLLDDIRAVPGVRDTMTTVALSAVRPSSPDASYPDALCEIGGPSARSTAMSGLNIPGGDFPLGKRGGK